MLHKSSSRKRQRSLKPDRSMQVPANLVGFSHGVPHWHMSHTTSETRALRKKSARGDTAKVYSALGFRSLRERGAFDTEKEDWRKMGQDVCFVD